MANGRQLDRTILREYDIRGLVGNTLVAADIDAIGRAFGTIMAAQGMAEVCVGYDGRHSSPEFAAVIALALASTGLRVHQIGLGPTPMLYFAIHELGTGSGVMITGSHNPPDYNGVKLVLGGKPFFGAEIQELGRLSAAGDFAAGDGGLEETDISDAYVTRLAADFQAGRALHVAWDPGNGAAGDIVTRLTARIGGRHLLINETIDGDFPAHHPDPTVEANLAQLKDAVAGAGCDLGFAFDGDGDRIGVIDGQGRVLWGDQLMVLFAREILARRPGETIIADVKASRVLFDEVERLGGKAVMWKSGHSLIKSKMAETGAPLAGEMSGHIFFADGYYGFDDALYAAVRLLSILGRTETSLAAMLDGLPRMMNTPELRFPCSEDRKFEVVGEVKARLAGMAGITVHDIDGVRVENEDGWWLLRASNTQAALVARCEAADSGALDRLKSVLAGQLRESGIEPPEEL